MKQQRDDVEEGSSIPFTSPTRGGEKMGRGSFKEDLALRIYFFLRDLEGYPMLQKCSRKEIGAGLWGWLGFATSDSSEELAPSRSGEWKGRRQECATLQQNCPKITASP